MAKATVKHSFTGMAEALSKTMTKRFTDGINIIQNLGAEDVFTEVTDWVSSGCQMLDLAISNRPHGGFPCGRISVLYGPEQSGKSLIATHALADTQKRGGVTLYIDSELAMHEPFCNAIGIDTRTDNGSWNYVQENRLEAVLLLMEQFIYEVRRIDKKCLVTIVLDSYKACITEEENVGDFGLKGYNTSKARVMSDGLSRLNKIIAQENICVIITNQVSYNMNAKAFESPWRMPGGQSLPHFASVIIQMKKAQVIKGKINGVERIIGRSGVAVIEKNRLGPPSIKVKFLIYFDKGVDNFSSYIDYMAIFKIGKVNGAWIEYTTVDPKTGEEIKFRENGKIAFTGILKRNPKVAEEIWLKICDNFIMAYSTTSDQLDADQITIEDEEESIVDKDDE